MRAVGTKVAKRQNGRNVPHNLQYLNKHSPWHGQVLEDNAYGYFYRKQAAHRPVEQARGSRLTLLLRLQRDKSSVVVYLGRCPRL